MSEERVTKIRARLEAAFEPSILDIVDDSERHRGHPGAASGGGHFNVRIGAAALNDQSRIAAHRAIYAALEEMMQNEIHALSIEIVPA